MPVEALQLCSLLQHMHGTTPPCSSIRRTTLSPKPDTEELVRSICHCHQYNVVEALVRVVVRASIEWFLHGNCACHPQPQTVVVVSSGAKPGSNFLPQFFSFGEAQHFVFVDRDDGYTYLGCELTEGTFLNPEAVLLTWIGIASG